MFTESPRGFVASIQLLGNEDRRARIISRLELMQCPFDIQRYAFRDSQDWGRNIVVHLPGTEPRIVVGAHYDVSPQGAGANDNGSGVAVLLKFISNWRGIQTGDTMRAAIDVVFFDHEETPESGARFYAESCVPGTVRGMFNMDICGYGDVVVYDDRDEPSSSVVQAVRRALAVTEYPSAVLHHLPASDEVQFERVGIPSVQLCALPEADIAFVRRMVAVQADVRRLLASGAVRREQADDMVKSRLGRELPLLIRVMHTPQDLAIHLSDATLLMMSEVLTEAIRQLA